MASLLQRACAPCLACAMKEIFGQLGKLTPKQIQEFMDQLKKPKEIGNQQRSSQAYFGKVLILDDPYQKPRKPIFWLNGF